MSPEDVNIRLSVDDDDDRASLERLAELVHDKPPSDPVMLAEIDGEPVAAVSLVDGATVEDPRRSSPGMLTLLRMRRWECKLIVSVFGA